MSIQAVIFDLDGTLTEPLLDFGQIRAEIGIADDTADILGEIEKMSPARQDRAYRILFEHEQYAAKNSRLNKGASTVMSRLKEMGLPIGLLTRNTMDNVRLVAETHGLEFDAMLDRDSGPAKPDGYGVRKLCRTFGTLPGRTLVVGDFLHDLLAATDAGAIAVLLKTHPNADEYQVFADYSICHLEEIFDIISKIEQQS
ncbi:MAG: HAD family hydrolase [Planctomycetota bacterium]|jgi:HAD superfamily hydrolase (TIGR01509 family)